MSDTPQMPLDLGLRKRAGSKVWQWHFPVPKELRAAFGGKRQLRQSLNTTDESEAEQQAAKLCADAFERFALERRRLNPQPLGDLTPDFVQVLCERVTVDDWDKLKRLLADKRIRVVALDLPTSWMGAASSLDETTQAILDAVNRMLLDMLAAVARKDYTDRRRRQAQGIQRAKESGLYRGRKADTKRHAVIASMLDKGHSWSEVCEATGASRSTIKRVVDALKAGVKDATDAPPLV